MSAAEWSAVVPIIPVTDVARAQAWYRDVLGCDIAWTWQDGFGCVFNGATELFVEKVAGTPAPLALYVRVKDADALHALYVSRRVEITEALGSRPWGMREFGLRDPDGHLLRFGHGERTVDQIPEFRAGG